MPYKMWKPKSQMLDPNKSHGVLIAVNGLDSCENLTYTYVFTISIFEKYQLPNMNFIRSSSFVVTNTHVHSRGLRVSRWSPQARRVSSSFFVVNPIGMSHTDELNWEIIPSYSILLDVIRTPCPCPCPCP